MGINNVFSARYALRLVPYTSVQYADDYRLRPSQPNIIIIIIMTSSGKEINWLPMNMNQWGCRDEGIGRVTVDR